eukprot:688713-Hanusia_phi.AAC.3
MKNNPCILRFSLSFATVASAWHPSRTLVIHAFQRPAFFLLLLLPSTLFILFFLSFVSLFLLALLCYPPAAPCTHSLPESTSSSFPSAQKP